MTDIKKYVSSFFQKNSERKRFTDITVCKMMKRNIWFCCDCDIDPSYNIRAHGKVSIIESICVLQNDGKIRSWNKSSYYEQQ